MYMYVMVRVCYGTYVCVIVRVCYGTFINVHMYF